MERDCTQNTENMYFRCRKAAALSNERLHSRERTAELLGLSSSTLANYELGITKTVPPDAVVMMSDLYNAPELQYHYCANDCPIGRRMPIPTTFDSIEIMTIRTIKGLAPIEDIKAKLLEVSSEGKVTKSNLPTVMALMDSLDSLYQTLGEVRLACQKMLAEGGVNVKG